MTTAAPDDQIYLNHLARTSEIEEVRAHEDIRTVSGVKLVNKGERVDASVIDRIVRHKLLKPVDLSISFADAVTPGVLLEDARRRLDEATAVSAVVRGLIRRPDLPECIGRLSLEPMVVNKLTVMRNRLPDLYSHSLLSSCAATALGALCGASDRELYALAGIGVLHDLGELHLDVSLLQSDMRFDPNQWRAMLSHPIVAFLILKQWPKYYGDMATAVLEYHERLDGSGYPRKLKGAAISKLGRITAVTEVVLGILQKHSAHHLAVVMKVKDGKLDDSIVQALSKALPSSALRNLPATATGRRGELESLCSVLSRLLSDWKAVGQDFTASAPSGRCEILAAVMTEVDMLLRRTGYSEDYRNWLTIIETDEESTNEVLSVFYEAFYSIRQALQDATLKSDDSPQRRLQLDQVARWLELADGSLSAAGAVADGAADP
jgi:hypothetical protein